MARARRPAPNVRPRRSPTPWPREAIPNSPANYWHLDYDTINNMQWVVTALDPAVPVFQEPHACVVGTVAEIIHEQDGDTHIWVNVEGTTKGRFACEITPQNRLTPPAVGQNIRICGIFRYDLQHGWPEIHPVDFWEPA